MDERTIRDFGNQWSQFRDNDGWYGSLELFADILSPLLDYSKLQGKSVAEIGSGTGRIVGMLLAAGARHVYAVEPAEAAFAVLKQNVSLMGRSQEVSCIKARGDAWDIVEPVDYLVSIGVIHHIPDPAPVIARAFEALKPGGQIFLWLYGYEGNELYLGVIGPLRKLTSRLPHAVLRVIVELIYGLAWVYLGLSKLFPLPLGSYMEQVFWPLAPAKRRLVIYDQLNPAYARYYRRDEALSLLKRAGFLNIQMHHRHGYSWSVLGQKPLVS